LKVAAGLSPLSGRPAATFVSSSRGSAVYSARP
jgi:hypothetical protein